MFSSTHHNQQYPPVPSSLRSDPYDTVDRQQCADSRPVIHSNFTPYLSLRARLSQIWINRWTVLLLLVLIRVVLLTTQLRENVGDAKTKALSACSKVEDLGSAMASMPHYLSVGVNELAAKGIQEAVHGMVDMLDLILQAVPAMIIFFINFMTATYTCLITAMVHGSLDVVASVTKDATKAFSDVIDGAAKEISDISGDLEKSINKITNGVENSVFGKLIPDIPKVDFSEPMKKLKGFDLNSDDFAKDIQRLNKDLPSFEDVQNITSEAVHFPFNIVRQALNETYGNWQFKKDVFPLAQKQQLTFCSGNDKLSSFFEKIFKIVHTAKVSFLVVLSLLAALAIAPMAVLEVHRWKRQQSLARVINNHQADPTDVVYIASRPITSRIGITLGSRFKGDRRVLARWCFAYATSPAALFVLSLAIAGFFSCFCQWLLLKAVQKEVPALANEVGAFAGDVVTTLEHVSEGWANDANGVIQGFNDDINKDVLEYVTNATDAVNNTINVFMDAMEKGLETVFNDTILLDPIRSVLHCVIGLKVESVQKGLTWIHDQAHVDFPLFPNDTFSRGAHDSISGDSDLSTFLSSPSSVSTDEVSGAIEHVTNWMLNNITQEALISTGILLVYIIVVLMGVVRMLASMASAKAGNTQETMGYAGDGRFSGVACSPHDHDRTDNRFGDGHEAVRPRHVPLEEKSGAYGKYDKEAAF